MERQSRGRRVTDQKWGLNESAAQTGADKVARLACVAQKRDHSKSRDSNEVENELGVPREAH